MELTALPTLSFGIGYVVATLREVLGRGHQAGRISTAVMFLVARRMETMRRRILRMLEQMQAGTLVVRRAPAVRVREVRPPVEGEVARRVSAPVVWPRGAMWLVRSEGYPAAGMGLQFAHLLGHPEMQALLLAAPQAARLLRPMCRMLGVATSLLDPRLPPPSFVPPVERSARTRVRLKRPLVDWGNIPLPRGVLAKARRERALERALQGARAVFKSGG